MNEVNVEAMSSTELDSFELTNFRNREQAQSVLHLSNRNLEVITNEQQRRLQLKEQEKIIACKKQEAGKPANINEEKVEQAEKDIKNDESDRAVS